MPRKGENIRKRKDGRWEGRYKIGRKSNGQIQYKSIYGKSYSELKEKMRQMMISDVKDTNITILSEITLEQLLQRWKEDHRLRWKGSTLFKYDYLISTHI